MICENEVGNVHKIINKKKVGPPHASHSVVQRRPDAGRTDGGYQTKWVERKIVLERLLGS